MIDFDKFDKAIDLEGMKQDIEETAKNPDKKGDFKEVPAGNYEVDVEKMELKESSKGDPMVSIWFKIVEGEYANSRLFMNQVIKEGFQIHKVNELLRSMKTNVNIEFNGYKAYNDVLNDVFIEIDDKKEFLLEYTVNKGFGNFKITEVYDLD